MSDMPDNDPITPGLPEGEGEQASPLLPLSIPSVSVPAVKVGSDIRNSVPGQPWQDGSVKQLLDLLTSGNQAKSQEGLNRTRDLPPEQRFDVVRQLFWLYDKQVREKPSKARVWLIPLIFSGCGWMFFIFVP